MSNRPRATERLRVPAPLLSRRVPAGRGAMEQPNATHDGDAALNVRFWLAIILTGVATGLLGAALMWVLFSLQHLAFSYHSGGFEAAVMGAPGGRRVGLLALAGVIGGIGWYVLRRATPRERADLDDAVWAGEGRLSVRRSLGTSLISEVVIALGASLGREAAPKLMGGVSGSVLAGWAGLTVPQRRLLVACGGGAGLAAVYNVPLGGALFTAEILCGAVTLPTVLPALLCAAVATATAWVYLPQHATYLDIPAYSSSGRIVVWAVIAGPLIGVLAAGYIRLIGWISHHRVSGAKVLIAMPVAFTVLGLLALAYPQLLGNGKGMAHDAFVGAGGLALLAVLMIGKPLVTAACLQSGASGGLFTPVLSTGAVLGGFGGLAWSKAWPGSPAGAYAMVGAAAMIGAAMQAPLAALALVLELTHTGFALMVPMVIATAAATLVARYLDGYSIYSARLPAP